jgi:phosphoglycolate phosphatase
MRVKNFIFDLDGTLVDSAPGILSSFRIALQQLNLKSAVPLDGSLIGPPLPRIVDQLVPNADALTKSNVIEAFKSHYDSEGVLDSTPFEGVYECLMRLHAAKFGIWIATNKRSAPTARLLHYLGWSSIFDAVYSLDSFTPALETKSQILGKILQVHTLGHDESVYVGDRPEDREAARECALPFIMVDWGYGGYAGGLSGELTGHVSLLKFIEQLA